MKRRTFMVTILESELNECPDEVAENSLELALENAGFASAAVVVVSNG